MGSLNSCNFSRHFDFQKTKVNRVKMRAYFTLYALNRVSVYFGQGGGGDWTKKAKKLRAYYVQVPSV